MKLKLKHLAPYLPYGLKVELNNFIKEIGLLTSLHYSEKRDTCSLQLISINYKSRHHLNSIKPILRPLSDLTKKIDLNNDGEKWCFMSIYFQVDSNEEEEYDLYGTIPDYWNHSIKAEINKWDYWQVEKLFEYHFDVFGLIEKGLAIDRNTLNKKSNR